jgi:hypothetical protein
VIAVGVVLFLLANVFLSEWMNMSIACWSMRRASWSSF